MSHATSQQVLKSEEFHVASSSYSLKIEIFDERKEGTTTPTIEFPEIDSVWWIKVGVKKCDNGRVYWGLELFFKANSETIWQSEMYKICLNVKVYGLPLRTKNVPIDKSFIQYYVPLYETPLYFLNEGGGRILSLYVKVSIMCKENPLKRVKFHDRIAVEKKSLSNLSNLFNDSSFSDFVVKVQEKEFKVHRAILAASSTVFMKMFQTNMQESIKGECVVTKFNPDVIEQMLRFVYGGNLPKNLSEIAMELYEAAHYYEIEELKPICKQEVHAELIIKNCLEIYKWASIFDIADIKADAWEIVKRHVLKIFIPLKNEPLTVEETLEIIQFKQMEDKLWKKFKISTKETEKDSSKSINSASN